MRFLIDENFNNNISRALAFQRPDVPVIRVQDVGLSGKSDEEVLGWALKEDCILLTHDVATIPAIAYGWIKDGGSIPGIIIVPQNSAVGPVVADLTLIIDCSMHEEWAGKLHYLPL
jgi:hypothetical protein